MACNWFSSGRKRQQEKKAGVPSVVPPSVTSQPIRATDGQDGEILNRSYSYWSTAWVDRAGTIFAFVGHADGQPKFFRIGLDDAVSRLGPLLGYSGTGEGWYWTASGDIMLCDGPRLRRVNPFSGDDTVVMDISAIHPDCRLWQAHSSDDGLTHSATVERIVSDGAYPKIGTVVGRHGGLMRFPALGALDESQVTPDGDWLIIKELDVPENYDTLYNRIISLLDRSEYRLDPSERIGHSDCGPGFVIGEDSNRGWCAKFGFSTRERLKLLGTWAMGGVSYRGGRCLRTSATSLSLVALDGSGETHLLDHGMVGDPKNYEFQCRASLDPTGRVASYVSNAAGRNDLYLIRLP